MKTVSEKDYLPTTVKEIQEQHELVELVAKMVDLYNRGLNDQQKQMLRDIHAELKGENKNQPDWSGVNYLKLMLEMVYMRGCAFGHIKGMSQMHNSYSKDIQDMFNNHKK